MNLTTTGFIYKWARVEARAVLMLAVLLAGSCSLPARGSMVIDSLMLRSIAVVENAPYGQVGPAGELGEHQMMPGTVRDRGGYGPAQAAAHLVWLRAGLVRAGVDPLPYNLALAWNAGLTAVTTGRLKMRHYEYAARVAALYHDFAGVNVSGEPGHPGASCASDRPVFSVTWPAGESGADGSGVTPSVTRHDTGRPYQFASDAARLPGEREHKSTPEKMSTGLKKRLTALCPDCAPASRPGHGADTRSDANRDLPKRARSSTLAGKTFRAGWVFGMAGANWGLTRLMPARSCTIFPMKTNIQSGVTHHG